MTRLDWLKFVGYTAFFLACFASLFLPGIPAWLRWIGGAVTLALFILPLVVGWLDEK